MPNFEPFRRSSSPRPEAATVTLTARGVLNLSPAAVALLDTPGHVRLFWDRDARVLGVRGADASHPDALRLSVARGGRTVAARAFVSWAGIEHSAARRWLAYLDDDVLCADLSQPGAYVRSNRSGTSTTDE